MKKFRKKVISKVSLYPKQTQVRILLLPPTVLVVHHLLRHIEEDEEKIIAIEIKDIEDNHNTETEEDIAVLVLHIEGKEAIDIEVAKEINVIHQGKDIIRIEIGFHSNLV